MSHITSFKPYIFNAYYQWFIDNGITPHIVVNTLVDGVIVPEDYILPNRTIVLSIAPGAVKNFNVEADHISFEATFAGHLEQLVLPFDSMEQLIAKEKQMAIPISAALQALELADDEEEEIPEDEDHKSEEMEFVEDESQSSEQENIENNSDDEQTDTEFEFVTDQDDK